LTGEFQTAAVPDQPGGSGRDWHDCCDSRLDVRREPPPARDEKTQQARREKGDLRGCELV